MKICDALKQALEGKVGSLLVILYPLIPDLPYYEDWVAEENDAEDYHYGWFYQTENGWLLSVWQHISTGHLGMMAFCKGKSRIYIGSERPTLVQITIEEPNEKD